MLGQVQGLLQSALLRIRPLSSALLALALGLQLLLTPSALASPSRDLLALVEQSTEYDLAVGGGLPSVVEFYADWCDVCNETAKDVLLVESRFRGSINFVMINIDNPKWKAELDEFGVDGIPQLSFLDRDGNELGFVVGKVSGRVLEANLQAMAQGEHSIPFSEVVGEYSVAASRPPPVVGPRSHSQPL